MLRRDFIMSQIEELGKVIAQIINSRLTGATRKIPQLLQQVWDDLRIDSDLLLTKSPEEIRELLNREDGEGLRRMEIAAQTLIEAGYLEQGQRERQLLIKSQEILVYLQKHDGTYSLQRVSLLEEIDRRLGE